MLAKDDRDTPAGGRSALAIIGVPFGLGAGAPGTSMGPAAARVGRLGTTLAGLGHAVVDKGDVAAAAWPQHPALVATDGQVGEVAPWMVSIHDAAGTVLSEHLRPIFIGGDHSISIGTISAVAAHARQHGKRPVVLWVDAHTDFNTPRSSPSGNLHGMALAFLTGAPELAHVLPGRSFPVLAPCDTYILGARSIDADEKRAVDAAGIRLFDMRAIDEFGVCALLREVLDGLDREKAVLHVSFDLDVLDPDLAPGVGTPVPGGLTYREAHLAMEMLHDSGLVGSVDFVELNPMLDVRGRTTALMIDLAASLFGRSISIPRTNR